MSGYASDTNTWNISEMQNIINDNFTLSSSMLTACQDLDVANTVYTLGADVSTDTTCFNITASNITLNCGGHLVTGEQNGYGINISYQENITVYDCRIRNFTRAISMEYTNRSRFDNNTMFENNGDYAGIYALYSNLNNITNSNFSKNNATDNAGLFMERSLQFRVINNTFSHNNVSNPTGIIGGGIIGLYDNSNRSIFYNLTAEHNNVSMTGTASANRINGSGIIGLYSYSGRNEFSYTRLADNFVFCGEDIMGGAGIGLNKVCSYNNFTNTTIVDMSISVTDRIYGGGSIGLNENSSRNMINGLYIQNNSLDVGQDNYGGGGIGVNSWSSDNRIYNVRITESNFTAVYL
jgi:hypothetical protein